MKYQNTINGKGKRQYEIVALAKYSRSDILQCCSYPSEKWVVKLLGKIPHSQCSPHLLENLRKILQQNNRKHIQILHHISRLNSFVINMMLIPEVDALFGHNFYNSACFYPETNSDIEVWTLIKEIIRFSLWIRDFTPPRANSVQDLQLIHDIYMEQYLNYGLEKPSKSKLWGPPIQELRVEQGGTTHGIFPLQSSWALYEEGKRMHHCIFSYRYEIDRQGDHYAYHVISPAGEKASIMLIQNGVTWRLGEIQGCRNQGVEEETAEFVQKWLTDYNDWALEPEKNR